MFTNSTTKNMPNARYRKKCCALKTKVATSISNGAYSATPQLITQRRRGATYVPPKRCTLQNIWTPSSGKGMSWSRNADIGANMHLNELIFNVKPSLKPLYRTKVHSISRLKIPGSPQGLGETDHADHLISMIDVKLYLMTSNYNALTSNNCFAMASMFDVIIWWWVALTAKMEFFYNHKMKK